ncbi:MAG: peptide ABC transporter substrate-binding protein, partial [Candidatus Competibacterales bacterium]
RFGGVEIYRRIYKVEAIDDKTFTVFVDRLTFDYNALPLQLLPAHLEKPIFDEDPANYHQRNGYGTNPTQPGLYHGPYRLAEVERGSQLTFVPNDHWGGQPPQFSQITIKTIPNTAALEANLLSGELDLIAGEAGITIDQALAFERRHGDRYQVLFKPGLVYEHLDVMLDNPILADVRVRRALLHGVDRQAINQQLFGGRQPVAHTNVNPLDWVYTDRIPQYDYDPNKAKALLEEAGWRLRGSFRFNDAGEKLAFDIMTTSGNRSRELVQQVLQTQWRQLGIDARINNQAARVFFGQTLDRRQFRGLAMFAWISSPESVPRTTLHSAEIPGEANSWRGQNYPGYRNPEMDALIDAIEKELDRGRRKALWAELQTLYARDLPALPLFFRADAHVLPRRLEGLEPTGHQYPTTLWVEDWRLMEP